MSAEKLSPGLMKTVNEPGLVPSKADLQLLDFRRIQKRENSTLFRNTAGCQSM